MLVRIDGVLKPLEGELDLAAATGLLPGFDLGQIGRARELFEQLLGALARLGTGKSKGLANQLAGVLALDGICEIMRCLH